MSLPVRQHLDLGLNQLLSALAENVTVDPATPTKGRFIFRTDTNEYKVGDGTAFVTFLKSTVRLDQIPAPQAAVAFNAQKASGLADPTAAQDAATKAYVDNLITGLSFKDSVRAATVGNVALTGAQTIDGVSLNAGERVLVRAQTSAPENGFYIVAAGAWARAEDANTAAELTGAAVFVEEGTTLGNTMWVLSTDAPIVVGTTALSFSQFGGGSTPNAGNGLALTGNTFDVNVDNATLEINADVIRIKDLGITDAKVNDLSAAKITAGLLALARGGLNADLSTQAGRTTARGNLVEAGQALVRKVSADITGNGALTQFTVTHNLGTTDVIVQVWEVTTNSRVLVETTRVDANSVRIDFAQAVPNAKVYRVVVIG